MPAAAALKKAEVSVTLTSDRSIKKLNKKWRNKNSATDVISFSHYDKKALKSNAKRWALQPMLWSLGDVVISVETAKRQAKEKGWTLRQEMNLLLAHALLHLLGFDHELGEKEAVRMARMERILVGDRRW